MDIKKQKDERPHSIKITIEQDGGIIGWGYLVIIYNDRHVEPYGLLENIYIEKDYRGAGVGSKIINALVQEAYDRGCYKLVSQSRHGKENVHQMYEKFGFKDHGKNFRMDLQDSEIKQLD